MAVTIAAFGALNNDSYNVFAERVAHYAGLHHVPVSLISAGPYPNARAESQPGRPLRAEALQDEKKKHELFVAVAADAKQVGALKSDLLAMPCMSMIGFHNGVEQALEKPIVRLATALADKYKDVDKVGVIHMRPAKKRIEEIFGAKAVIPDEKQAAALLAAEETAQRDKTPHPVYTVMKEIVEAWRDQGVTHVLFARADAPKAHLSSAGMVDGVIVNTYFDILAEAVVLKAKELKK